MEKSELDFFATLMPDSRPAGYYLGCLDGCVYLDFDDYQKNFIRLKRISFDGFGCCGLGDEAIPMNEADSVLFKEIFKKGVEANELALSVIVKTTIRDNRNFIWEDALKKYHLCE